MSVANRCQCTGCADCEPWEASDEHPEASGEQQHIQHCRRAIVHFIDNRCDECHEEEVDEMFADTTGIPSKEFPAEGPTAQENETTEEHHQARSIF